MTNVTLQVIRLQEFDDEDQTEETLTVTFVNFNGDHEFVLGDEDAAWKINSTQVCANNTQCIIKSGGETVTVTPLALTWISNTASSLFSINGGDYKIEFSRS